MKIFCAALGTETNTFSPIPTSLKNYQEFCLYRPGEYPDRPVEIGAPLWVARQRSKTRGWTVVEGTCAAAPPAGITVRGAYEQLRDEILQQLSAAMPLDAAAFAMHGAMVAEGYEDCEGDMMQSVRKLVGNDVAIGLEIDPHCHLSDRMVSHTDVIILFKEYPHTDEIERAEELLDLLEAMVVEGVQPHMAVYDCRMLGVYHTTQEPMKSFVRKLQRLEQQPDILSISVVHGFPWGDVADIGTKILVVTDNKPDKGAMLARELGQELLAMRGTTYNAPIALEEGIAAALKQKQAPIILSDTADNPGGGAPGDSTFLLAELMTRQATDVALGPLWDPVAVQTAIAAGASARIQLRIGGKMGPTSGFPIDVLASVTGICRDARQRFSQSSVSLGDCVAIHFDGIEVVLSSKRNQAFSVDLFTNVGINPVNKRIVVVKSSQHFYDSFAPIAKQILYLDSPGALVQDLSKLNYQNSSRKLWHQSQSSSNPPFEK